MTGTTGYRNPQRSGSGRDVPAVITDAKAAASAELAGRQKRYAITMAFRTACFIAMIFVPGVFRWILFVCALFLPYIAVILANQANQRGRRAELVPPGPNASREITAGPAGNERRQQR